MRRLLALSTAAMLVACSSSKPTSGPARPAETERYFTALEARYDGDTRAYYDGLLELAHDEPDSRAGRKARAVLQSDGGATAFAMLGIASATAIPAFTRFQAKSKQSEAKAELRSIYVAQSAFFAEKKRYCRTFKECGYEGVNLRNYTLVMGPREVVVPPGSAGGLVASEATLAAEQVGLKPRVEKKKFLVVAVANLDADLDHDVWTIDETGSLVNVASDVE